MTAELDLDIVDHHFHTGEERDTREAGDRVKKLFWRGAFESGAAEER